MGLIKKYKPNNTKNVETNIILNLLYLSVKLPIKGSRIISNNLAINKITPTVPTLKFTYST